MVKAAVDRDERTLDQHRLRAGTRAAGILAEAFYTVLGMAKSGR